MPSGGGNRSNKEGLYDKYLEGLPAEQTPGATCSINNIKQTIQLCSNCAGGKPSGATCSINNIRETIQCCSCCAGGKPSPEATENSSRGGEGVSEADLFKSEKEQRDFLKKIYEPVERARVHGFDYDVKSLKMLLLDERSQDSFKLIGVVGVLGVGKTTLCRQIFNDEEVKQRFIPRLWIPMSEEPWKRKSKEPESMEKVVERMLEHLGVQEETINHISADHKLPGLLYALYLHLKGKRFLIVLDNVRDHEDNKANMTNMENQNRSYYEDLVSCLKTGHGFPKAHGGAVIMTSRNEEAIKKMVGEQNLHRLLPLWDPESCWAIYKNLEIKKSEAPESAADVSKDGKQEAKKVEQGSGTDVPKEVKEELKKRCGGFPLVARMMREIKQLDPNEPSTTPKDGSGEATTASTKSSSNEPSTTNEGSIMLTN